MSLSDVDTTRSRVHGHCALCRSRCGCISVVEDGRLVRVEPDPSHPTGAALCGKGRAAPELVYHPDRLLQPLRRTRPKADPDPGWEPIGWDEALKTVADAIGRIAGRHGAEAIAFAVTSPSASSISDSIGWVERLVRAFGSPNICYATEICNWHKDYAHRFTFGTGIPTPDYANAGAILLWGHNPRSVWLAEMTEALEGRRRGARLVVVDPRRTGLATKADLWLRVRPGSDGALALGIAAAMIDEGRIDEAFVRDWTNGPLLVRDDDGRLLTEADLSPAGSALRYVAWDDVTSGPVVYDPAAVAFEHGAHPALTGTHRIRTATGEVACRPAFDHYAEMCRSFTPERVERTTWVDRRAVGAAARLIFDARPIAYYTWTGVGQTTNATQTDRAIALLATLTGSFDAPGGNVMLPQIPVREPAPLELFAEGQREKALGLNQRPLGPARTGWVTADDLYRAAIDGDPYRVRGLVGFGSNLVLSQGGVQRARQALEELEFHVQLDHFLTPTARFADIVLPVTTAWEHEGLRPGFEITAAAQSELQLRPAVLEPLGEARSDTSVVFDLAVRLGLSDRFFGGDIDAAYRHLLEPSGVSLEELRAAPGGRVTVPLETRYRKYAERSSAGVPTGFATPTRRIEVYSDTLLAHGYAPLPDYVESAHSPVSRPDLAERFPLVLTCAKLAQYCQCQHRGLPSLRRAVRDPQLEIHPRTAAERRIADGDWVTVETTAGSARARARFNPSLHPDVVSGQHGWWQDCPELGAPGYDPFDADGANFNLLVDLGEADPVSGSVPHRSGLCEVRPVARDP